jgi:hypothetical protein
MAMSARTKSTPSFILHPSLKVAELEVVAGGGPAASSAPSPGIGVQCPTPAVPSPGVGLQCPTPFETPGGINAAMFGERGPAARRVSAAAGPEAAAAGCGGSGSVGLAFVPLRQAMASRKGLPGSGSPVRGLVSAGGAPAQSALPRRASPLQQAVADAIAAGAAAAAAAGSAAGDGGGFAFDSAATAPSRAPHASAARLQQVPVPQASDLTSPGVVGREAMLRQLRAQLAAPPASGAARVGQAAVPLVGAAGAPATPLGGGWGWGLSPAAAGARAPANTPAGIATPPGARFAFAVGGTAATGPAAPAPSAATAAGAAAAAAAAIGAAAVGSASSHRLQSRLPAGGRDGGNMGPPLTPLSEQRTLEGAAGASPVVRCVGRWEDWGGLGGTRGHQAIGLVGDCV